MTAKTARRRFLGTLLAAGAAPMLPAHEIRHRYFIGCRVDRAGRFLASIFDQSGRIRHDVPLPGRGHGFAVQPTTGRVVVFARRPGDWALVLNPATGAVLRRLAASLISRRMRQYAGSVSFDATGRYVAASHPHEGIVSLWATRPAGLMAFAELADTCGIAGYADAGGFMATGAGGRIARIDARMGESTVLARSEGSHWDNHPLALGARA